MWGYKIEPLEKTIGEAQKRLEYLGDDGWELVSIVQHPNPRTFMPGIDESTKFFAFFKKEIKPKRVG